METLERVLASSVVAALCAREHVLLAPSGGDALCDEVEAIIAPALGTITPHLPGATEIVDEITSTFGHEHADEAVVSMVEQIAEQLMESDHVDDIFAEDRIIRRDAFRAIREILLGYIRGEIEVEERREDDAFEVALDALGYVVSAVSRRVDEDMLREALERAAASVGGQIVELELARYVASFDLPGGAAVGRLALEEAITDELVTLVEADLVELPSIEQILELADGSCSTPGFAEAIARAEARIRRATDCAACCIVVDANTLVASLTPLSKEAAAEAETSFSTFLAELDAELTALDSQAADDTTKEQRRSCKPPSGNRRNTTKPPRSSQRDRKKRSVAPEGRESCTHQRTARKAAGKKRGAKS